MAPSNPLDRRLCTVRSPASDAPTTTTWSTIGGQATDESDVGLRRWHLDAGAGDGDADVRPGAGHARLVGAVPERDGDVDGVVAEGPNERGRRWAGEHAVGRRRRFLEATQRLLD